MRQADRERRYSPHRWVIVKHNHPEAEGQEPLKVFGMWYGGYLDGDSWQLNSGITKVELKNEHWWFSGHSGSVYICDRNGYGLTGYGAGILTPHVESGLFEVIEERDDWTQLMDRTNESGVATL